MAIATEFYEYEQKKKPTTGLGANISLGTQNGKAITMPTPQQLEAVRLSDASEVAAGATVVNTPVSQIPGATAANPVASPVYTPTPQQQTVVQKPQFDIRAELDKLRVAELATRTAGLDKAKASALSNLSADRAKIQPTAIADRNKANIGMNNVNRAWSELMASKFGQSQSGSANLGYGLNQAQYLGNVGTINRNATNAELENDRRVTDVNNNYLSDLEAARAGVETNYLNRVIDQMNNDREFEYRSDRDTIGDTRYDREYKDNRGDVAFGQDIQKAGLTGMYNGKQTMAGKEFDLNNKLTNLQIDTSKLNLDALPQKIKDEAKLLALQIENGEINRDTGKAQLKELTDYNSVTNKMARMGFDTAKLNFDALPQQIKDQAKILALQIENGEINRDVGKAQLKEITDPNSVTNKTNALTLEIKQLEAKALPEMQKQQLAQIKAQIAQIGKVKPLTEVEKNTQSVQLAMLQEQLYNMRTGKTKDGKPTETNKAAWTEQDIATYRQKAYTTISESKLEGTPTQAEVDALLKAWGVPLTAGTTAPPLAW